jgi:hypothetical protein
VVGLHVVLDQAVDDLDREPVRGRDGCGGLARPQLRAADHRVDRLDRKPSSEALHLRAPARGQRRVRGHAGSRLDALRFGVADPDDLHADRYSPAGWPNISR